MARSLAADTGEKPPPFVRRSFPRTWYYPKWRLLVWHPRGILNAVFLNAVLEFLELEERDQEAPFDRYVDFSALSDIRLKLDHVISVARRRRVVRQPAKSALVADKPLTLAIAQIYEHLMEEGMIEVRAFRQSKEAAKWLEVPQSILRPF